MAPQAGEAGPGSSHRPAPRLGAAGGPDLLPHDRDRVPGAGAPAGGSARPPAALRRELPGLHRPHRRLRADLLRLLLSHRRGPGTGLLDPLPEDSAPAGQLDPPAPGGADHAAHRSSAGGLREPACNKPAGAPGGPGRLRCLGPLVLLVPVPGRAPPGRLPVPAVLPVRVPLRRGAFPGCIAEPKRIGRRAACTRHAACEAACPTGEAAAGKAGTDCYVCGRCLDACPVPGARGYGRRGAVR